MSEKQVAIQWRYENEHDEDDFFVASNPFGIGLGVPEVRLHRGTYKNVGVTKWADESVANRLLNGGGL